MNIWALITFSREACLFDTGYTRALTSYPDGLKPVLGYDLCFSVDIGFDTASLIIKEHEGFHCLLILLKLSICVVGDTADFNGGCR